MLASVLAVLPLLSACASAEARQERMAWQTICAYVPHVGGQEIGLLEQRAMDVVGAWDMSVAEVDAECAARHGR